MTQADRGVGRKVALTAGRRGARALLLLSTLLAGGCSVRKLAINMLADALVASGDVFSSDEDPQLVREALPFALKTLESLLAQTPRNRGLLLAACSGFTEYGYAFVAADARPLEMTDFRRSEAARERGLQLVLRGRDYCLRSLEMVLPGALERLQRAPEATVAELGLAEVPLLYWTGAAWGAAISLGLDRPELVVDLPAVRALVGRALELEETYDRGALHEAMMTLEAVPEAMGGSRERAREHFRRAVELSRGERASPYVALAEQVAIPAQDLQEFRSALEAALDVDPDADASVRVANLLAQERARFLLEHIDDYFLDTEGGDS